MKKSFILGVFVTVFIVASAFTACIHPADNTSVNPSVPAHSHQWGAWEINTPATCTEKGEETRICTLDVTHIETREIAINPNAHDWQQLNGTAPTCTTTGNGKEKCQRCGTEKNGVIPIDPDAHDWRQLSGTAPTCTETGSGKRKCNLCNEEETFNIIPALGHNYVWVTTAPTCTTTGTKIGTCTRNANHTSFFPIPIDPNAHDWQQLSGTEPTCEEDGSGKRKCNLCNEEETLNIIPALGHNYAWVITTASTCTTAGVETGTCTHNATHIDTRAIPIDPNAHNWGNNWTITTPPTIVQGGTETDTCTHNTSHTRTRSITAATFTDIADLETYLSGLSDNTAAAAYTVKLNVNDIGGDVRTAGSVGYILSSYNTPPPPPPTLPARTSTKYVNLDLSGSTLTYIEVQAFQSCYGLAGVIIPNSVTEIRGSAFNRCTGFTSVTIPSSVTILGDWAFGNNTNLISVTFQGTIPAADFGTMGVFFGDLRDKFYATNATNGTPGTYTTTAPVSADSVWTKK